MKRQSADLHVERDSRGYSAYYTCGKSYKEHLVRPEESVDFPGIISELASSRIGLYNQPIRRVQFGKNVPRNEKMAIRRVVDSLGDYIRGFDEARGWIKDIKKVIGKAESRVTL
jgi:hypothetical protein